ncbi:MAG: DNA cytosine methyltransferase [Bacillota bacterium]
MEYTVLHLFAGIGGAALGMQEAVEEYRGMVGRFRTLAGIDCDPAACRDFEMLTGAPAVQMDLFSRDDYIAFHGSEPPAGWREVAPEDLLEATGGICPDVLFTSPPCKGFSGLLPSKSAASEKYQALNRLTVRGLKLALEAFADDMPGIIILENVPRITTRGASLLDKIKRLLKSHGYLFHEGYHDCGEIGGLGQRRKRYLLIARHPDKIKNFVYQPPQLQLKSIGEVIGPLPLPDDPAGGAMHRLPRLQWKTWVRLALIPAGGDWRDLEKISPGQYQLEYLPRGGGSFGVQSWDKPAGTVVGNIKVNGSNAANIADPRTGFADSTHTAIYRVNKWDEPARTITGANRPNNGAICIADPRLGCKCRDGSMGVQAWDQPGKTVTGSGDIHSGAAAVADPRIPADTESGVWVIIAPDGTWHRPLTTWELMALQGFPLYHPDGNPVVLAGSSDAKWRERIGNAVPPPAAKAIGQQILRALLLSAADAWELSNEPIWVLPNEKVNEVVLHD